MAVEATYTKDIHYSGIITVDGETVVSMDANMDAKHPDVPIINLILLQLGNQRFHLRDCTGSL